MFTSYNSVGNWKCNIYYLILYHTCLYCTMYICSWCKYNIETFKHMDPLEGCHQKHRDWWPACRRDSSRGRILIPTWRRNCYSETDRVVPVLNTRTWPFSSADFSCGWSSSQWSHWSPPPSHPPSTASSPGPCSPGCRCHSTWAGPDRSWVKPSPGLPPPHLFCCLSLSLAGMDLSINKTIRAHCLIHSFFISAILA